MRRRTRLKLILDLDLEELDHTSIAKVGMLHIDLIDVMHDLHIFFAFTVPLTMARNACSICLALNGDLSVVTLYHYFSIFQGFI
ncbi:hypothetical protein [Paenibacillus larvae]|uniref:hypothetical protein n=1 Tax=Paenibacillus larvae TaxID=1464 RepID=UPI0037C6CD4D